MLSIFENRLTRHNVSTQTPEVEIERSGSQSSEIFPTSIGRKMKKSSFSCDVLLFITFDDTVCAYEKCI